MCSHGVSDRSHPAAGHIDDFRIVSVLHDKSTSPFGDDEREELLQVARSALDRRGCRSFRGPSLWELVLV